MSSTILAVTVSLFVTAPSVQLPSSIESANARAHHGEIITAQRYGDNDPHGSDPHGRDPHDEIHDMGLPANSADARRTATDDVYGGKGPGANSQHPLDNFPGQPGF